jgi:hypothetical protein
MKRRVCSYDMFAGPDPSFVLNDTVGEMYFCNLRCSVSGRCSWLPGRTFLKKIRLAPIL